MPIEDIQLRKFLLLGYASRSLRKSKIRGDIRLEIKKRAGEKSDGGDFYGAFWKDAREHVFGVRDLTEAVGVRVADNWRRRKLYPQLRDGFLLWWNERRRWTNEPFQPGPPLKAQFPFPGLAATIRIDSILSVRDGVGVDHYVYPYFAPTPPLDEPAAQLGLWLLGTALPDVPLDEIRILDVIRGRTFSVDRTPLIGDEEIRFRQLYEELIRERDELRKDYE